jgi:hypothetical protein
MWVRRLLVQLACVGACLFAPAAAAASGIVVGAAEDASKQSDPVLAKAKMDLAQLAGLDAVRITTLWTPHHWAPSDGEANALRNAAAAASLDGIRLFVSIYPSGGRSTPQTPMQRAAFASYAAAVARLLPTVHDFIIGNEPNLNRFWMPQFDKAGDDVAAESYEPLLAITYDVLKAVDPSIRVIGGAVSPRGGDRPGTIRPTHSPTTFIPDLGRAYRESGRTKPIMDAFAFHPYLESSRLPPTFRHPRSTTVALNDYDKLVGLLGKAFDGTAQRGSRLPIFYDEFGVQSAVSGPRVGAYTDTASNAANDAVPESVQAAYYVQALRLARCQPTVLGLFFFHVSDETDLAAWQSGLYYADDQPKSSLAPVRAAALAAHSGKPIHCA